MQNKFDDYGMKQFKNRKDMMLQTTRRKLLYKIQQTYVERQKIHSQTKNKLEIRDRKNSNQNKIKMLEKFTDSIQKNIFNRKTEADILRFQADQLRQQINRVRQSIKNKTQKLEYLKSIQPTKKSKKQIQILEKIRAEGSYQKQIQKYQRQCEMQLQQWLKQQAEIVQYNKNLRKIQSQKKLSNHNPTQNYIKKQIIIIPPLSQTRKCQNIDQLMRLQLDINSMNMKDLERGKATAKKYLDLYKLLNPIPVKQYEDFNLLTLYQALYRKIYKEKNRKVKSLQTKKTTRRFFF